MQTETFTRLMSDQSDGMIFGVADFVDLSDGEFFKLAGQYLETHDFLRSLVAQCEKDLKKACLSFGDRTKMWGVNPDILRRELKLRGYYGV
jgi:hypothetical protein